MRDWLTFSSLVPAGAAAALLLAAGRAMGVTANGESAALAASGTLFVYNVDRLRDLGADRATAPQRTAFIEQHRGPILVLTVLAAICSGWLALQASGEVLFLCGSVLGVGLLHRRLKQRDAWKALYVTAAWVSVTAGIPAFSAPDARATPWVLGVYSGAIGANLLATQLRQQFTKPGLLEAGCLAAAGMLAALLGPADVSPLVCVPGCVALALTRFRPNERYGLVVVDGALLLGGITAVALQSL